MDAQTGNGATLLHFACRSNVSKVVQFLFSHDITSKIQIGEQVLTIAAEMGNLEILKLLVKYGADVFKHGGDAMIWSAKEGQLKILRFLRESGASVNYINLHGFTPLYSAALFNRSDVVQYLLDENAKVNVYTPSFHRGPVDKAVEKNNLNILKMLVEKGSEINYEYLELLGNNPSLTPLLSAVINGTQDIVKFLISKNASINMKNNFNDSALHVAVVGGDPEIFKLLLDLGADAFQLNSLDLTPTHVAAMLNRVDFVKIIIQRGYKINDLVTEQGSNLLILASSSPIGAVEVAEYILSTPDGKEAVNYSNKLGITALHVAVMERAATIIAKLLLEHGANINARTAIMSTPLMRAIGEDNLEAVRLLVNSGADVNLVNNDGNSSLHIACGNGDYDIVDILLSNGADVNVGNKNMVTPLHFATQYNASLVELLIVNMANPFAVDKYGTSVLHYAASAGNVEVVKLLLRLDVDVFVRRVDGFTALDLASMYGSTEVAYLLTSLM